MVLINGKPVRVKPTGLNIYIFFLPVKFAGLIRPALDYFIKALQALLIHLEVYFPFIWENAAELF